MALRYSLFTVTGNSHWVTTFVNSATFGHAPLFDPYPTDVQPHLSKSLHENRQPIHAGPNTGARQSIHPSPVQTTTKPANQPRPPNQGSGILAEIGGSGSGVARIGSSANEDLEVSLGAQNPDCGNSAVEGARQDGGAGLN